MEIKEKVRTGFEGRVKKVEDFIESKGLGSTRLKKAKKMQHKVNFALIGGSILSVVGAAFWALKRNNKH